MMVYGGEGVELGLGVKLFRRECGGGGGAEGVEGMSET